MNVIYLCIIILFLVEKSPVKINCVLDCLLVCPHFIDWSLTNARPKRIIEDGESESEVCFN